MLARTSVEYLFESVRYTPRKGGGAGSFQSTRARVFLVACRACRLPGLGDDACLIEPGFASGPGARPAARPLARYPHDHGKMRPAACGHRVKHRLRAMQRLDTRSVHMNISA